MRKRGTMTAPPDELAALGRRVYGDRHGWVARMAADLAVNYDNLRKMLAGGRPVPMRLLEELRARTGALPVTIAAIPAPPATLRPEVDRDGPCGEALDPALDALAAAAEAAGWHPAEVAVAILTWSTHRIADGAGKDAAQAALEAAAELLAMQGAE